MTILEAAQAVVDGAEGTSDGVVLVPVHLLDALADAVDRADAEALTSRCDANPHAGRGGTALVDGSPAVGQGHQPSP